MKKQFKKPVLSVICVKAQNLMTASASSATTASVYNTVGTGDVMAKGSNADVWND